MKTIKILFATLISIILLQSCANSNKIQKNDNTFWVSGVKVETSNGAGKIENFLINKNDDYKTGVWQNFYAPIAGFTYEEGYLKKIEVATKVLDKNTVPADASSIQYTLVKEIDKQQDDRALLKGDWTLVKINNHPINRMVAIPTLTVQVNKMMLSGNDGCNAYSANIKQLSTDSISLKPIIATMKACIQPNMASEYYAALQSAVAFKVDSNTLQIIDNNNQIVLTFLRTEKQDINGTWKTTIINGITLDNNTIATPEITIDTEKNTISGNNSCNIYNGSITKINNHDLQFGTIASTKKMCVNMETANNFDAAITKVKTYKISNGQLVFYNENGNALITFIKK